MRKSKTFERFTVGGLLTPSKNWKEEYGNSTRI